MRRDFARAAPPAAGLVAFLALIWPVLDPGVQLFYRDTEQADTWMAKQEVSSCTLRKF